MKTEMLLFTDNTKLKCKNYSQQEFFIKFGQATREDAYI